MKILLLGEYSNVHWTLAEALRALGHEVTVISNGDFWKDYRRDIDLSRTPGRIGGIRYMLRLLQLRRSLVGYDVVQLINPMFLELKAERIFPIYKFLRRHNQKIVLGAFGMDCYWVHENITRKPLRYSDFNIGNELRNNRDALKEQRDWIGTLKGRLNQFIAKNCDFIVTGLYEYDVCYRPLFPDKTTFIPFPINLHNKPVKHYARNDAKLRLFIGINSRRSEYKGTDIMLKAARYVVAKYPDKAELEIAENVPFHRYQTMLGDSDVILDQLYSYTPAMNALEAMSQGVICVGGGEPESYDLLHEQELRPIVNVRPDYDDVVRQLEFLVLHPEEVSLKSKQSIEYVRRHHDAAKVALQYEKLYRRLLDE